MTANFFRIAKRAAGYFGVSASTASLLFALVGLFVVIAPHITVPVAVGVGLVFAIGGARSAIRESRRRDAFADRHLNSMQGVQDIKLGGNAPRRRFGKDGRSLSCSDVGRDFKAICSAMNAKPAMIPEDSVIIDTTYQQMIGVRVPSRTPTPESSDSLDSVELLEVASNTADRREIERAIQSRKQVMPA